MRRASLAGLLAATAAMVSFGAVAFACTPQANIGLDKPASAGSAPGYAAGDSVLVFGYGFDPNSPAAVAIRLDGSQVASAPVDDDGRMRAAFLVPASLQPGAHTVTADSFDERGQAFRPAASLVVAQPVAAAPAAEPATAVAADDALEGAPATQAAPVVNRRPGEAPRLSRPPSRANANRGAKKSKASTGAVNRRSSPLDRPAVRAPAAAARAVATPRAFDGSVPLASPSRTPRESAGRAVAGSHPAHPARAARPSAPDPSPDDSAGLDTLGAPQASADPGAAFAIGVGLFGVGLMLLFGCVLVVGVRRRRAPAKAGRNPS